MTSTPLNTSTSELLDCREDFFREGDSKPCVPSCYTWKEYTPAETIIYLRCDNIVISYTFISFKRMRVIQNWPVFLFSKYYY